MKIAMTQIQDAGSYEKNIQQAFKRMEEAHQAGVKMICFPEIQFTPFFPKHSGEKLPFQFAETVPGPTVERFQQKAREWGMVVILNLLERFNGDYFDASPVIDADGTLLGVSRMVHIPNMPGFHEQDYYTPSDSNFRVYHTAYGQVGILICFDRHYPEAARILAINDAEIILIPSANLKTEPTDVFDAEMIATAFQNGIYVGMINRVGVEDGVEFAGGSILVDPDGKVICQGNDQPGLIIGDVDLKRIPQVQKERPYLQLRRPEEYFNIIKISVD